MAKRLFTDFLSAVDEVAPDVDTIDAVAEFLNSKACPKGRDFLGVADLKGTKETDFPWSELADVPSRAFGRRALEDAIRVAEVRVDRRRG